jgi:hypothetical protein
MNETEKNASAAVTENHGLLNDSGRLRFYAGAFVLDTVSGLFYRLTPAAYLLLQSHTAGVPTRQFAELLQQHYGIDSASATRDVELLLNQVASLGLLTKPSQEAAA